MGEIRHHRGRGSLHVTDAGSVWSITSLGMALGGLNGLFAAGTGSLSNPPVTAVWGTPWACRQSLFDYEPRITSCERGVHTGYLYPLLRRPTRTAPDPQSSPAWLLAWLLALEGYGWWRWPSLSLDRRCTGRAVGSRPRQAGHRPAFRQLASLARIRCSLVCNLFHGGVFKITQARVP